MNISRTQERYWSTPSAVTSAVAWDQFEILYPTIRGFLLSQFEAHSMPQDAIEYFTRCLDYNTFTGKYKTGLLVVEAAEAFKGRRLDDSEYQKAAILGWMVVFLHSYFSVSDGIVNQVTTSHGKLSWHHVDGVGSNALNDVLLLEGAVYQLAREHFRKEPYYVDLLELLHETRHPSFFRNPVSHTYQFPIDSQRAATIYKSAIYSFYLPMALSMIICGFPVEKASPTDLNYYDFVLDILLPLGEYAQIQTEYFESRSGNLPKTRSWCYDLVRSAGSPEQFATLESHFGKENTTSQLHVRSVFAEAGIDARYSQYAEDAYTRIGALIDALPELRNPGGDAVLGRAIFRTLLEDLHSRTD
ncbi:farnesyl diphosphate synthase [Russula ochroleuca]|uniref:Farnesyl diphosphate synthase n=1 Tax=Russula ochroleuca TaxID=152965 RepID=A0A9P5N4C9_9AGAM|nr:farnesyl diphosphate synthase [Russula ochroleuca]